MTRFLTMFLLGWLIADVGRGSMNPLTPIIILFWLIYIVFIPVDQRFHLTFRLSMWLKTNYKKIVLRK